MDKMLTFIHVFLVLKSLISGQDWLEGARDMGGIFRSCEITWRELQWPDLETHLNFGSQLLQRLDDVFLNYINQLFNIVMTDNVFDKWEFVLILKSVANSVQFLESMFHAFNEDLRSQEDGQDYNGNGVANDFAKKIQKSHSKV